MQLGDEQIKEFKAIYEKEFGVKLNDKDALEKATKVINFVRLIYKPIKKEN